MGKIKPIEVDDSSGHYDEDYFNWQREIGEFGGEANVFKFQEFIKETDNVVEFGCGGGYLLDKINCQKKIGIEVNPDARRQCDDNNITCYENSDPIEDGWADVIISNSVLEHVPNPLETIHNLHRILREGGHIVFVVPHEKSRWKYAPNDINQHLYTWSPMALGNLFNLAGYSVDKVEIINHVWIPRYYTQLRKIFGKGVFNMVCGIYARLGGGLWKPLRITCTK